MRTAVVTVLLLLASVCGASGPMLPATITDMELGRWVSPVMFEHCNREHTLRRTLENIKNRRTNIQRLTDDLKLAMLNANVSQELYNLTTDVTASALDFAQARVEHEMKRNLEMFVAWLDDGSPDRELAHLFRYSWEQAYVEYLKTHDYYLRRREVGSDANRRAYWRDQFESLRPLSDPIDWGRSTIIRPLRDYSSMTLKVTYLPGPLEKKSMASECLNATPSNERRMRLDALRELHNSHLRNVVRDAVDPHVEMVPFADRLGVIVQNLGNESGRKTNRYHNGRIVGSLVVIATRRWANVRQFGEVAVKTDALLQAWNTYYAKRPIPHPLIESEDFLATLADELTLAASANVGNLTGLQRLTFEPDQSYVRHEFFHPSVLNVAPFTDDGIEPFWFRNLTTREFLHDRLHRFVDGTNATSYLNSREQLHLVTELKLGSAFAGVINFISQRKLDPRAQDDGFTSDATVRAQMHFSMFLSSLTGKTSLATETAERLATLANRADYDVDFDIVSLGHTVKTTPPGISELLDKLNTYDPGAFTSPGSGESDATAQTRRQSNMASVVEAAINALSGVAERGAAVSLRSFSAALEDFGSQEETESVGMPIGYRSQSFTRLDVLARLASETLLPEWRNFVGPSLNTMPASAYARLREQVLRRATLFTENATVING